MVVLGYDSTIPVTVDDMIHHGKAVVRGAKRAHVVVDMPFGSYQTGLAGRDAQRHAHHAGDRRRLRQARGRRARRRDRPPPRRGRHPRHGPRRPHPAVGQPVRRLQAPGQDPPRGCGGDRRRPRPRGGRRLRRRPRDRAYGARAHDHAAHQGPHDRHRGGPLLQRPGAGLPRHARPLRGFQAEARAPLCPGRADAPRRPRPPTARPSRRASSQPPPSRSTWTSARSPSSSAWPRPRGRGRGPQRGRRCPRGRPGVIARDLARPRARPRTCGVVPTAPGP